MGVGYTPERFVWAHDKHARRSGPVHRDLIDHEPDRYKTDDNHPVVDSRGVLLASKPDTDKAPTTKQAAKAKED